MAAPIHMAKAAIVLVLLHYLSLSSGQAMYPSNLCGFPSADEDLPIQCFYSSNTSLGAPYACCPAKSGCCGSQGCCQFNGPVRPIPQGYCGLNGAAQNFPIQCFFNNDPLHRYVCCDGAGCNGFNSDNLTTPRCKKDGYVPAGYGLSPPPPPPQLPPPAQGTQGVCGTGVASSFPFRCYFNNDPAGRYICCDLGGCNGFSFIDDFYPKCAGSFYLPPNFGVGASAPSPPATTPAPSTAPPAGSQGVCGTGAATDFPVRCYYNSDPQGRYVCCDANGCDGFNPPDNFVPHCKKFGYVPPTL